MSSQRIAIAALIVAMICHSAWTQTFGVKHTLNPASTSANVDWGQGMTTMGDVDGDGIDDIALGAPGILFGVGRVRVNSGADGSMIWQVNGPAGALRFGNSIARLPDQNGDGVAELAVGAPNSSIGGAMAGAVFVLSGANGAVINTIAPGAANNRLGDIVVSLKIGNSTYIVASRPLVNGSAGGFTVFHAVTGAPVFIFTHVVPNEFCAAAMASAGDFDGDGDDELVVGFPGRFNLDGGTGEARLFDLSAFVAPTIQQISGGAAAVQFGAAVAGVGDLDADGLDDIAVGDPAATVNLTTECGLARTFTGPDATPYSSNQGVAAYWHFGASLAGIGDLDGDGHDDVAFGAPQVAPSTATGRVIIRSGRSNSILGIVAPAVSNTGYGSMIAAAGDIDRDNLADVIVADVDENLVEVVGPLPTYVGSREDLALGIGFDQTKETYWPDVRMITGPFAISMKLFSPRAAYNGTVPLIGAWLRPTAGLPVNVAGFPELHLSLPAAVILFDPFTSLVFGPTLLPPQGLVLSGIVPAGFAGNTVMLQGFALAPSASMGNAFFTATNALQIDLQ